MRDNMLLSNGSLSSIMLICLPFHAIHPIPHSHYKTYTFFRFPLPPQNSSRRRHLQCALKHLKSLGTQRI
jgi:hypothetical protein